jgi:putative transposase
MRKFSFENNQIYHIFNRGVEKRSIFLEDNDYLRFIHDLFELNDKNKVNNVLHRFSKGNNKNADKRMEVRPTYILKRQPRELMVEILAFTLMPNHFHLILKQKTDNGIAKFMQKLGTGYAMYFNNKNNRVGGLFQGKFKAVLVDNDEYLIHLLNYIHFNPLDLIYGGRTSLYSAEKLMSYRWGSFLDYIGEKNFPSVTSRQFLLDFFGSEEKYRVNAEEWLKEKDKNILKLKIEKLTLEN